MEAAFTNMNIRIEFIATLLLIAAIVAFGSATVENSLYGRSNADAYCLAKGLNDTRTRFCPASPSLQQLEFSLIANK